MAIVVGLFLVLVLPVVIVSETPATFYDSWSINHHDVVADVMQIQVSNRCPSFRDDSGKFHVVCDRKSASKIGACDWESENWSAKFVPKPRHLTNETPVIDPSVCNCFWSRSHLNNCPILTTIGSRKSITIFAMSPKRVEVQEGLSSEFWVEYNVWDTNGTSMEWVQHSTFFSHIFNTPLTTSNYHHLPSRASSVGVEERSSKTAYRAFINFKKSRIDESGVYKMVINVGDLSATFIFVLDVRSESNQLQLYARQIPQSIQDGRRAISARFLEINRQYQLVCSSTIGDLEMIQRYRLRLENCDRQINDCSEEGSSWTELTEETIQFADPNGLNMTSSYQGRHLSIIYTIEAKESAYYRCLLINGDTRREFEQLDIVVVDIEGAVDNHGLLLQSESETYYEGDRIKLQCRYQNIDYQFKQWHFVSDRFRSQTIIHSTKKYNFLVTNRNETGIADLSIEHAQMSDSGEFLCQLMRLSSGQLVDREVRLRVRQIIAPVFMDDDATNRSVSIKITGNETQTLILSCSTQRDVDPIPKVTWKRDGSIIADDDERILDFGQTFKLYRLRMEDAGNYTCTAWNKGGYVSRTYLIGVITDRKHGASLNVPVIAILSILSAFVIVLFAIIVLIAGKLWRKRRALKALQMHLLRPKMDMAAIDPDVPIHQQPENLAYDNRYEISKDRLVLGAVLGEGHYGRVLDGQLLTPDRRGTSRVAVKVPKDGMNVAHQTALISEVKIMMHIGNHVNVLSLVAVVIDRIQRGELYIATEFCKNGSLKDFLLKSRSNFIDQLKQSDTGRNPGYIFTRRSLTATNSFSTQVDSSRNSRVNGSAITTIDLLSFAYQVANGMDYLVSKSVYHRDLALRNILLTDQLIVKIGDFGLALHGRENEQNKQKGLSSPLPIKWMALESIRTGEFSAQSDVWSFGVVLWEIFSLAETPYSNMAPDMQLCEWLIHGNRLAPPKYASEEMYHLMTQCWKEFPQERLTIVECRDRISMEMHLRSPQALDQLINMLNSYHLYVNTSPAVMINNTAVSETAKLLLKLDATSDQIPADPHVPTAISNPIYETTGPQFVADKHSNKKRFADADNLTYGVY